MNLHENVSISLWYPSHFTYWFISACFQRQSLELVFSFHVLIYFRVFPAAVTRVRHPVPSASCVWGNHLWHAGTILTLCGPDHWFWLFMWNIIFVIFLNLLNKGDLEHDFQGHGDMQKFVFLHSLNDSACKLWDFCISEQRPKSHLSSNVGRVNQGADSVSRKNDRATWGGHRAERIGA